MADGDNKQPQQEGFWHSIASAVGIDPEAVKATAKAFRDHPEETAKAVAQEFGSETAEAGKELVQHPVSSAGEIAYGTAATVEDPNAHQRAIDEMKQPGWRSKVAGGEEYLEATVPFIGGGIEKSQEQANTGNYRGAAGTMVGTIAPMLAGGEEAAAAKPAEEAPAVAAKTAEVAPAEAAKPAAPVVPDHVDFSPVGGKEQRGPMTFGRTGGKFGQAVDAAFDIDRKYSNTAKDKISETPEEGTPQVDPQYEQALARRGEMPNQKVTMTPAYGDTGRYVGGLNMMAQERQSALREPYQIKIETPDGVTSTEEIPAFSPKSAMAIAQKKFPDASSWQIESFGERKPSTEYSVPTGKHLSLPAAARPIEQVMPHELGHAMIANKEGLITQGMIRHTHVDASRDMSAGVQFGGPGVFRFDGSVRPEKAEAVVRTLMGGIAADEVFNNLPRSQNINFDFKTPGSDANTALRVLQKHGYDTSDSITMIQNAIDDNKTYLQHPGVSSVIKENAGVREPDLSRQYHFSAERLQNMHEEAQRRIANGTESDNQTVGGKAGAATSEAGRPEGGAQGAEQTLKAAHVGGESSGQIVKAAPTDLAGKSKQLPPWAEAVGKAIQGTNAKVKGLIDMGSSPLPDRESMEDVGRMVHDYYDRKNQKTGFTGGVDPGKWARVMLHLYPGTDVSDLSPILGKIEGYVPVEPGSKVVDVQPKEPFEGVHYSPVAADGDVLKGSDRGKAQAGSEKDRLQHENAVPGVYAYRAGAPTESQISSRANKYNISGNKAIADIGEGGAQNKLFTDAHKAAFDKYKTAGDVDTMANQKALNDAEAAVRDAGFDGYEDKAKRPGSVFLFGDQKIAQPEVATAAEIQKGAAPKWAKSAVTSAKKSGGFTVNPTTGETPTDGYQIEVGTENRRQFDSPPTAAQIAQFAEDHKALLDAHPELHVGGYGNELNISAKADSLSDAKKVAKKLDQISIWDNANKQEIQTGGKNQRAEFPNYPLEDRLSELKGQPRSDIPDYQNVTKEVYDNLEPDERDYIKGSKILQNNVMNAYHELQPSVHETTNAMQAGAALGGWWKRYIDIFHNLAEPDSEQIARDIGPSHAEILKQWHAALSGNKSVQDANNLAWHSYADWLDAGKPTDRESIDGIIRANGAQPEGSAKKGNAAISDTLDKKGNVVSKGLDTSKLYELVNSPEMKGERPFHNDVFSDDEKKNPLMDPTIGARKIPSMGATVAGKGNLNRLVIDTHIRDFYGQPSSGSAPQYIADSVHLRQAAKALGLKGGEGQEQLWGTVLGLKTLLREGLTPPEAAGKLDSGVINQIGKDYAEVIANDPEITKPGGILDRIKEKYGIGRGSEGFGEAYSKALSASASQGEPGGGEEAVDRSQLGKTAERIRGTIAESRIKSPAVVVEKPESAPTPKTSKGRVNALALINLLSGLKSPGAAVGK